MEAKRGEETLRYALVSRALVAEGIAVERVVARDGRVRIQGVLVPGIEVQEEEFVGEVVEERGEEKRGGEKRGEKAMIGSDDVITSKPKKYPIDIIVLNKSMLNREKQSTSER